MISKKQLIIITILFLLFIFNTVVYCNTSDNDIFSKDITKIEFGYWHSIFIKEDGLLASNGANWFGQLGNGNFDETIENININNLTNIKEVKCGSNYNIALKKDGTVWAWGNNDYGQLGNDILKNKNFPGKITLLNNITSVACGESHNLALRKDGTVWAWGNNYKSQLGDYEIDMSTIPLKVESLLNIKKIACGTNHNLALKADGTVWAWGANEKGQLGNGITSRISAPVQVRGLSNIVEIACGESHNLALKDDGTVWAWGSNGNGQLGNNNTNSLSLPMQIKCLINISSIVCGESHNLALKDDGTVWAWGSNTDGQLGDGSTKAITTPIKIEVLKNIKYISTKFKSNAAIDNNNNIWVWGDNWKGQLGCWTEKDILTPHQYLKNYNSFAKVYVNNVFKTFIDDTMIYNNRIFLPINEFKNFINIKFIEDLSENTIQVFNDNYYLKLEIIKVNNVINSKKPIAIKDGEQILIPLRYICEHFNLSIEWQSDECSAFITSNAKLGYKFKNLFLNNNYLQENKAQFPLIHYPKDIYFKEQWALYNTGQVIKGEKGTRGIDIGILPAWNITQGEDSIVGIIDTGIDIYHEDLYGRIYNNLGEIPNNNIDDDSNGYIDDINGWDFLNSDNSVFDSKLIDSHGTMVAGIISGNNNDIGICGVAPKTVILPLKVMDNVNGNVIKILKAIEYAEKMGIRIINFSGGFDNYNPVLKEVIGNSSMIYICAAGNKSNDVLNYPSYPSCFNLPNILSVASITSSGNLSTKSNFGKFIDVAAPGTNIWSTYPHNSYSISGGTSFSAPVVTGIASLIKSYKKDIWGPDIVLSIMNSTVPSDTLNGKVLSGGRANAYLALTYLRNYSSNTNRILN